MAFELQKLLRPHILNIKPYSSARDEYSGKIGVFLDANENPYGSLTGDDFNRYPDPYQADIKQKLAPIKGVKVEQIFLGNGSDEAIDLLMRAFCNPGKDNIILLPPTYGMYEVSAAINDIAIKKAPLTEDFQLQPELVFSLVDKDSKVIFICSPNNPSGNKMDRNAIRKIIEGFDGLVVVDEAYIDFSDEPSFTEELERYPNLLVMQTFSKAWGLANLRIGMAFASKDIIRILNLIKPPYNISGLTQQKVLESLEMSGDIKNLVHKVFEEKLYLENELPQFPFVKKIFSSQANFLLVKMDRAREIYEYLIKQMIILRDRSKVQLCEDCLRISLGTREENMALIQALKTYSSTLK
ncbi:MAG: histidinol-phosphate transaminase [Mongoliibacter sp.]|uniref:histidinol-phosphate transaminase n=1 Tax=Mongoliibacter sp. TaxID=2022438 RepID=UPI0012F38A83|nr:histidinol-phosphate transaminase [Mongoliibacter sp.]TVP49664.1 MAG: histidinol-phosphate transaminase [Mongoliibacter sp.]